MASFTIIFFLITKDTAKTKIISPLHKVKIKITLL
jgi:hypothetical protein